MISPFFIFLYIRNWFNSSSIHVHLLNSGHLFWRLGEKATTLPHWPGTTSSSMRPPSADADATSAAATDATTPVVPLLSQPIPFVMLSEDSTFEIAPEAVAYLKQIKGSVAVVSIAGLYRTGKSYVNAHACLYELRIFGGGVVHI